MQVATHSFEEHGGELKLRVVAPTPGELFEHAGRVLADLMSGEALGRTLDVTQHVVLASPDRGACSSIGSTRSSFAPKWATYSSAGSWSTG